MATPKQRRELECAILADRPDINQWIMKNLLDLYCSEDGAKTLQSLVKDDIKNTRKGKPVVTPKTPSVVDGVTVSEWNESWESRSREISDKVNARLLSEDEAASRRGTIPSVTVDTA